MRSRRRFRGSAIANELGEVADLLPDEQSELALKLRYGIGLEQLIGAAEAAHIRPSLPGPRYAPSSVKAEPPREPDAGTRARAAALGISAGRRGQWLSR